jgi:hypothetical protein
MSATGKRRDKKNQKIICPVLQQTPKAQLLGLRGEKHVKKELY